MHRFVIRRQGNTHKRKSRRMSAWWKEEDDVALLTQVNNDLPFLKPLGGVMDAWNEVVNKLLEVDGFSRTAIDGKKTSSRFSALMKEHEAFQHDSQYRLSGSDQVETEKIKLLDDLLALYRDRAMQKREKKEAGILEKESKEETAHYIRDQAMKRSTKRAKSENINEKNDDDATPSKKKAIFEFQRVQDDLEKERLAYKKQKLEMEMAERQKDREEREQIRLQQQRLRESEQK